MKQDPTVTIDKEAAVVIRRILAMCAAGSGPSQIARVLKSEKVLCPTMYAYTKYGSTHIGLHTARPYNWTSDTVSAMLENELYLGNTINMKYSTKSYKDKRKVEHTRGECLVFENTHSVLVTREVWDVVQRVRQNKRRRTNMDEQNKYSGLVVCADCGTTMVLQSAHTMKPSLNHFTCRTYKKLGSKACTSHYIWECVLEAVVLEDLRRVTAMAREHTREFAEYISGRQSVEVQCEIRQAERELTAVKKCGTKLDTIFKRLYEDSVLGRITPEQFRILSSRYTEKMQTLQAKIPETETTNQKLREQVSDTEHFIALAKRYTDIQELIQNCCGCSSGRS